MQDLPLNVIHAVQHHDPYPYYATLRQGADVVFDHQLNLWIVTKAKVIRQLLTHPAAKVRPSHEAVPTHLSASTVGQVFSQLIRMTDGPAQQQAKAWLQVRMQAWSEDVVRQHTLQVIRDLPQELASREQQPVAELLNNSERLNTFIQQLPVRVIASLLALPPPQAQYAATAIADFIRALAPVAAPDSEHSELRIAMGNQAAQRLLAQLQAMHPQESSPWQLANFIGLLMQSYEATAGLISNSLVALTQQQLWQELRATPKLCPALVAEVARFDPPVQNTRRFLHEDCEIAGVALPAGSTILLVLAAAGRDPEIFSQPGQFRLDRPQQQTLTFSHGMHQCPGQPLALQISALTVEFLLSQNLPPLQWRYQPSLNGRLSWFYDRPATDVFNQQGDQA